MGWRGMVKTGQDSKERDIRQDSTGRDTRPLHDISHMHKIHIVNLIIICQKNYKIDEDSISFLHKVSKLASFSSFNSSHIHLFSCSQL